MSLKKLRKAFASAFDSHDPEEDELDDCPDAEVLYAAYHGELPPEELAKVTDHMAEQERVLVALCEVAKRHDLPVILHTRKAERRTLDILREMGVEKADFHCFGGKLKLARQIADAGYYLSIPPVVVRVHLCVEIRPKTSPSPSSVTCPRSRQRPSAAKPV